MQGKSEEVTRPGQIVTFYSYKGGTGRSMALANMAFILASQGKRVLVIDWDLEAPGLHRYFAPFLEDAELGSSPGLIDYFYDVISAAAAEERPSVEQPVPGDSDEPWWKDWTSLLRYSYPLGRGLLESVFPGSIDFIPAGRQTSDYGERVGQFDWRHFYQRLGGGVLLEAVKERLKERYDYTLIDSRTGLSDTSGICTVQMPDDLVVCFTFNRQSVAGAAAVARSATSQRLRADGIPGLRVWPVPTRVEFAERERLESAKATARSTFLEHIGPLLNSKLEREMYWGRVEILYQPYFAYEEVLAVFAERRHQTSSMLSSLEFLAGCLTAGAVTELGPVSENVRQELLARFLPKPASPRARAHVKRTVYVSYDRSVEIAATSLVASMRNAGIDVWFDRDDVLPGDDWMAAMRSAISSASAMVRMVGPNGRTGEFASQELAEAVKLRKRIIPVLANGADYDDLPSALKNVVALKLSTAASLGELSQLVSGVSAAIHKDAADLSVVDSDDPQKGQWGGASRQAGRVLLARVVQLDERWFDVELRVETTPGSMLPMSGSVKFHLHPTFRPPVREVDVVDGQATLRLTAFGAFTVGVETDGGSNSLELDLALDPSFPELFRAR